MIETTVSHLVIAGSTVFRISRFDGDCGARFIVFPSGLNTPKAKLQRELDKGLWTCISDRTVNGDNMKLLLDAHGLRKSALKALREYGFTKIRGTDDIYFMLIKGHRWRTILTYPGLPE